MQTPEARKRLTRGLWYCEDDDWFYEGTRLRRDKEDEERFCVFCGRSMEVIEGGDNYEWPVAKPPKGRK